MSNNTAFPTMVYCFSFLTTQCQKVQPLQRWCILFTFSSLIYKQLQPFQRWIFSFSLLIVKQYSPPNDDVYFFLFYHSLSNSTAFPTVIYCFFLSHHSLPNSTSFPTMVYCSFSFSPLIIKQYSLFNGGVLFVFFLTTHCQTAYYRLCAVSLLLHTRVSSTVKSDNSRLPHALYTSQTTPCFMATSISRYGLSPTPANTPTG